MLNAFTVVFGLSPYCVIALPFTLLSLYFLGSNPVLKGVGYRFLSIVGAFSDMYNISTERTSRNLTRINRINRINCGKKNKCPWTRPEEATPTIWVYSPILFFGSIIIQNSCEIFICEITRRAWLHAEENKRRTLQRSDVASAVSRSDQFDFLIDIVPREEPPKMAKRASTREEPAAAAVSRIRVDECLFEELCSLTFFATHCSFFSPKHTRSSMDNITHRALEDWPDTHMYELSIRKSLMSIVDQKKKSD